MIIVGGVLLAAKALAEPLPQKGVEFTIQCVGEKSAHRKVMKATPRQNVAEFVKFENSTAKPFAPVSIFEIRDGTDRIVAWMTPFQQCSDSFFRILTPLGVKKATLEVAPADWSKLTELKVGAKVKARLIKIIRGASQKTDIQISIESVEGSKNLVKILESGSSTTNDTESYSRTCIFNKETGIPRELSYVSDSSTYNCKFVITEQKTDPKQ